MGDQTNEYRFLVRKLQGKKVLEDLVIDGIVLLNRTGVDWINLASDGLL
jgi:hypothetical protein